MAGPWDKYSNAAAPSAASSSTADDTAYKPWERYAIQSGEIPRATTGNDAAPAPPSSSSGPSLSDRITNFSAAAGAGAAAGFQRAQNALELAAAGVPVSLGDQASADKLFADVQQGTEQAQRLEASAARTNKAGGITGQVLSLLPQLAAGEAVLPARGAEGVTLGARVLEALQHGLPVATGLGTEQAANRALDVSQAGGSTDDALQAFTVALPVNTLANLAPMGAPGNLATRALTGGLVGAGTGVAGQEVEHLASPTFVPEPTLETAAQGGGIGAVMNALLGGRARAALPESVPEAAVPRETGPLAIPAPEATDAAAAATPAAPMAPEAPVARAEAPTAPSRQQAEASFRSDPAVALKALDRGTLAQVAQDAGFDVSPGESHDAIVGKLVGQGRDFLHNDVLPEYLAAVSEAPAARAVVPAAEAAAPTPAAPEAQGLPAGAPVAIDRTGTAYTPEQGSSLIRQAMEASQQRLPGLPEPRTIVDSQGNAVDSAAYLRQLRDDQDRQALLQQAEQQRRDLGLTPDIERANAPRWAQQARDRQAIADRLAGQEADRQAMLDARDAAGGELAGQRLEDLPPEFGDVESALAADRQAREDARAAGQSELATQGENDTPPWWLAGQDAERRFNDGRQREAVAAPDRQGLPPLEEGAGAPAATGANSSGESAPRTAADERSLSHSGSAPTQYEGRPVGSWIIRDKRTGEPVTEVFSHAAADAINTDRYEAVPAMQHLQELNAPESMASQFARRSEQAPARVESPAGQDAPGGEPSVAQPFDERGAPYTSYSDVGFAEWTAPDTRRPDWSPQVEGRAITAIDATVKRYGGSTLADSIRDDLREHQVAQLVGKQISSPEDLAALASVYRNPAFETMRYVFTDRNGLVIGETAVSSRMPSSSVAWPTDVAGGAQWVKEQGMGATRVWLVHNHPSGNPRPSAPDVAFTQRMAIQLGDLQGAPKLAGHVILDHQTFGHIDDLGTYQGIGRVPGVAGADMTRRQVGDPTMFDLPIKSAEFAAQTGKRIAAATPENSSAVMVIDAEGKVVSVHTFPNDFLATPRGAAMMSRLGAKRGAGALGIVTSTENFAKYREAFQSATQRGLLRDAIVVAPNGRAMNLAGTELFPKELRQRFGQQSAGIRQRAEAGTRVFEEGGAPESPLSLTAVRRLLVERGLPQDRVDAMSRDELRAEQATLRRRSPPTPAEAQAEQQAASTAQPGETTGIKHATVDEERALKGKDEIDYDGKREFGAVWDEAAKRRAEDPQAGLTLAREVIARPRALTAEETALLIQDRNRMYMQHAEARRAVAEAMDKGDGIAEAQGRARMQVLEDELEISDQAGRASGYEQGLALASRRLMSRRDYSMAEMLTKAKVAKGGKLTAPERAEVERLAKLIEAKDAEIAALKAKQAERTASRVSSPSKRKASDDAFAELAAQLKAIAAKDQLKPGCVA